MKYLSLALISVLVFGLLLWGISLLFPSNVVVSRASNLSDSAYLVRQKLVTNEISLQALVQNLNPEQAIVVKTADIPFYENNLYNLLDDAGLPKADTLFFSFQHLQQKPVNGGLAFYQLSPDSSTMQAYYVLQEPWYKPWNKFKLMVADKTYGPGLDAILEAFKKVSLMEMKKASPMEGGF